MQRQRKSPSSEFIFDHRPRITDDFHSLSDEGWYVLAYLITATALTPTWGKIYKTFAIKSVFILDIVLFMSGSLICGVARSSTVFIIGRAIAGIGSGGVFTGSMTIISFTVPLQKRPRFMGSITALFGVLCSKFSIHVYVDIVDCKFRRSNSWWSIHG